MVWPPGGATVIGYAAAFPDRSSMRNSWFTYSPEVGRFAVMAAGPEVRFSPIA